MGGVKACDLKGMDPDTNDQQIRSTCFTSHMLKMRVQEETYNDETRIKVSVTRCLAEQCSSGGQCCTGEQSTRLVMGSACNKLPLC